MLSHFFVVPAIPKESGATRNGVRFYCQTEPIGFDIYDNVEKRRLPLTFPSSGEAEDECRRLNHSV